MWKIRNPKRVTQPVVPKDSEPPNYDVPRFVARQMVALLRFTYRASDELERMFPLLPDDHKPLYAHLVNIDMRPSFYDLMKLIDVSEQRGLLSLDEAASLRAGQPIDNPIPPDTERIGNDHRKPRG